MKFANTHIPHIYAAIFYGHDPATQGRIKTIHYAKTAPNMISESKPDLVTSSNGREWGRVRYVISYDNDEEGVWLNMEIPQLICMVYQSFLVM